MSAILSPCGQYRFRLERDVQMEGIVAALFGVNPSTADAQVNDATIRKDIGFAKVHGWRRIIKGNVCAYRATDVRELATAMIMPSAYLENLGHLQKIIADADILVPCWGRRSKMPLHMRHDIDRVLELLVISGKPVFHFGLTACGQPKHPLMLGYDTPLTPWAPGGAP